MITLPLILDDKLNDALEAVAASQGRNTSNIVLELVKAYVETEQRKRELNDPALSAFYEQLADEDAALAEEGMSDYARLLEEADGYDAR